MKKFLFILISIITFSTFSQIKLKTYGSKIEKGFEFLADNEEYCPVSVNVDLSLKNMSSSKGNHKIFVIPARTKGHLITTLRLIKVGKYGFSSKTRFNYGNHFNNNAEVDYQYNLPFKKGESFRISQGYNGSGTHQNENSLDFTMPIGTDVFSARGGVVVKVVDSNTETCYSKACSKFNNVISIYHKDGTFSNYVHIDTKSAVVKPGDIITKGQLIAKSGNIGWSSGPHLHFVVFNQKIEVQETLKTKFRVNDGLETQFLKEKETYFRNY